MAMTVAERVRAYRQRKRAAAAQNTLASPAVLPEYDGSDLSDYIEQGLSTEEAIEAWKLDWLLNPPNPDGSRGYVREEYVPPDLSTADSETCNEVLDKLDLSTRPDPCLVTMGNILQGSDLNKVDDQQIFSEYIGGRRVIPEGAGPDTEIISTPEPYEPPVERPRFCAHGGDWDKCRCCRSDQRALHVNVIMKCRECGDVKREVLRLPWANRTLQVVPFQCVRHGYRNGGRLVNCSGSPVKGTPAKATPCAGRMGVKDE